MATDQSNRGYDSDTHQRLFTHWLSSANVVFITGFLLTIFFLWLIVSDSNCGKSIILLQRINPNTASSGSLIRLSGIGPASAFDIIQYREKYAASGTVFSQPGDLQLIHGIGPKTVEKIQPWLTFENIDFTDDKEVVDGGMGN